MKKKYFVVMSILALLCVGCGKKNNNLPISENIATATDVDVSSLEGYDNLNNVYFCPGEYIFNCDNQGTYVYFSKGQKESMSICVKSNDGMTKNEMESLYKNDLSDFYGKNFGLDYMMVDDREWTIFKYSAGINSNKDTLVYGYLYSDGTTTVYIENQVDRQYGFSGKVNDVISSIIIK